RALLAVIEAVVEIEDLPLALGQVGLEHRLEEVAPGDGLDVLLDIRRRCTCKTLAKARAVTIAAVDRCVEAELGSGYAAERPNRLDRLVHLQRDLLIRGRAAERLRELRVGAREAGEVRVLVERDAHG